MKCDSVQESELWSTGVWGKHPYSTSSTRKETLAEKGLYLHSSTHSSSGP